MDKPRTLEVEIMLTASYNFEMDADGMTDEDIEYHVAHAIDNGWRKFDDGINDRLEEDFKAISFGAETKKLTKIVDI